MSKSSLIVCVMWLFSCISSLMHNFIKNLSPRALEFCKEIVFLNKWETRGKCATIRPSTQKVTANVCVFGCIYNTKRPQTLKWTKFKMYFTGNFLSTIWTPVHAHTHFVMLIICRCKFYQPLQVVRNIESTNLIYLSYNCDTLHCNVSSKGWILFYHLVFPYCFNRKWPTVNALECSTLPA